MAKKTTKKKAAAAGEVAGRLLPKPGEVIVRMYRIGHGDCFLLAFEGDAPDKPVYVLIDCGYKPGSSKLVHFKEEQARNVVIGPNKARDITQNIRDATGGHIDVAVITHEHQDHVNGISAKNFEGISISETWFAWTENPEDDLANALRVKFKDQLIGLVAARNRLAAADPDAAEKIDRLIEFELGGEDEQFNAVNAVQALGAAAAGLENSANKQSMKLFKDLARKEGGIKYLRPHEKVIAIPRAKALRVFALGPPRDEALLEELDPEGREEFHGVGLASSSNYFAAAAVAGGAAGGDSPFAKRYRLDTDKAFADPQHGAFFITNYGQDAPVGAGVQPPTSSSAPEWRRIDKEWLYSAEQLALDMNDATNNASLVLAFELGKGGKVLLFAADAQRGNWLSWGRMNWRDGDDVITTKDLLSRAVLYKVGHHCSHNATLNGKISDEWANLSWMATGDAAGEFTAMITAVRAWAETQKGWDHPLKAIKDELLKKASGRVLQTDTAFAAMKPDDAVEADWTTFEQRVTENQLYFDYRIQQ
ncbi:hypothetical protein NKI50_27515 [Mesorhizobium sp. M0563]|uniref:hypothetical protein n=1 Tax=Mesorhizobium sp. M0563 TaxID=2956959 RepID=UPI003334FDF1